jgi:hypothetical protein
MSEDIQEELPFGKCQPILGDFCNTFLSFNLINFSFWIICVRFRRKTLKFLNCRKDIPMPKLNFHQKKYLNQLHSNLSDSGLCGRYLINSTTQYRPGIVASQILLRVAFQMPIQGFNNSCVDPIQQNQYQKIRTLFMNMKVREAKS